MQGPSFRCSLTTSTPPPARYPHFVRHRSIALLALVLTGGAAASAGAARRDPAYDDDRALAEVASHEYRFETETDVTLPSVRCELPEVTSERPHLRGSVAIVLGRSHLGVEGRQVMALSPDPASDLEARSSGTTLLPLAAELAYQARVTQASGAKSTRVDVYADEAMPFSALRSVLGPTDLGAGLVVRDAETGHLRRLELTPSRGVGCRNEFLGHLVLRDGKLVSIEGTAVEPKDVRGFAKTGWDVVLHVVGDPRVAEVASTIAAIDHSCAGAPDDREPSVYLDLRSTAAIQADGYEPCQFSLSNGVPRSDL